ncbi:MAG: Crp/Fnr family transcriptional regulator [Pseudomonadota bacterium]|nr:Crp/Fnr family transcriptional regulator [Pseudomonadota bacterium]
MSISRALVGNTLLAALAEPEYEHLVPALAPVTLSLGDIIYESGGHLGYVYFPVTAIVSLVYVMENGATMEMGLVGNEGVVGIALFMGGETTPNRAIVQSTGTTYRLPARILKAQFKRAGMLQLMLLRYTQALITQMSQTAVCNRVHSLMQRVCRWLLLCHDRVSSDELLLTQELIAMMLGGRRESVTVVAGQLQDLRLIHYSRGHIKILDRQGLERAACECYQVVKTESDRLLSAALPP